jgi:hypothetical protein
MRKTSTNLLIHQTWSHYKRFETLQNCNTANLSHRRNQSDRCSGMWRSEWISGRVKTWVDLKTAALGHREMPPSYYFAERAQFSQSKSRDKKWTKLQSKNTICPARVLDLRWRRIHTTRCCLHDMSAHTLSHLETRTHDCGCVQHSIHKHHWHELHEMPRKIRNEDKT